jgi:hypothetical protein
MREERTHVSRGTKAPFLYQKPILGILDGLIAIALFPPAAYRRRLFVFETNRVVRAIVLLSDVPRLHLQSISYAER